MLLWKEIEIAFSNYISKKTLMVKTDFEIQRFKTAKDKASNVQFSGQYRKPTLRICHKSIILLCQNS